MRPLRVRMKFLLLELSSNDDDDNENAPHGRRSTNWHYALVIARAYSKRSALLQVHFFCMASGHDVKVGDINSMDKRDERYQLVIVSRESESMVWCR